MAILNTIRLAVGIIGNGTSLLLYAAPMLTFRRVIREKSTAEFSCLPYIIALFNCFCYTWYGFPVVSNGWENLLLSTVNGTGMFLECFYICTFLIYAQPKPKMKVAKMVVAVVVLFSVIAVVSAFAIHDHKHRKFMIGIVGFGSSVAMYGAPLCIMKKVIRTKSVEFMPFYLSFFSFVTSSLWMTYGALSRDIFLAAPNVVGCPLGLAQVLLYCIYRKKKTPTENGQPDPETGLKTSGSINGGYSRGNTTFTVDEKVEMQKKPQRANGIDLRS